MEDFTLCAHQGCWNKVMTSLKGQESAVGGGKAYLLLQIKLRNFTHVWLSINLRIAKISK